MDTIKRLGIFIALITGAIASILWYQAVSQPVIIAMDRVKDTKNIIPLAIIGSGPAGLSAALYGSRSGLYSVVFQGKTPGGQLMSTTYVENWPGIPKMLGPKIIEVSKKQAEKHGTLMVSDIITGVNFSKWPYTLKTDEGHTVKALSVIIATGSNPRLLSETESVPGEKEYFGYGVSSCAVCDAPFYKGKDVVVVGGGDSAVEEATLLTSYAKKVTMLVRGTKMRASEVMQKRLKDYPKIKVLYMTKVTQVLGDGSVVTGVQLYDKNKKRSYTLKIDGVFLAIGHKPNTDLVRKWLSLAGDSSIALTTRTQKTKIPGVFAAGDVADNRYRQAGVAAGDGIKAALDAIEFLQGHGFSPQLAKKLEKNYYDPDLEKDLIKLDKLVTSYDFDMLASKNKWVVIEVGAEHCASCKTLEPIVRSVATKLKDRARFAYIDLGDDPKELIRRLKLKALPAILIFKKGKLVARYDQQLFSTRELYSVLNSLISENQ